MKIKWELSALLTAVLLLMPALSLCAQDADTISTDALTNDVLSLSEMMASNNIVTNSVGIVLIKIAPTLWAGKYEVTQDSYKKVMNANPSVFSGADRPVDSVSWNNAMEFCRKLTEMEKKNNGLTNGYTYSLPTQSQWMTLVGNATLNDAVTSLPPGHNSSTKPVGSLDANNLGLYDTRGNVMEWCLDPQDRPFRVLRGGAWDTFVEPSSRIEFRNYASPGETKNDYGFRVILQGKDSDK